MYLINIFLGGYYQIVKK